jgi:hypothetical protein
MQDFQKISNNEKTLQRLNTLKETQTSELNSALDNLYEKALDYPFLKKILIDKLPSVSALRTEFRDISKQKNEILKLSHSLQKLEAVQKQIVTEYLGSENREYIDLVRSNMELLTNPDVVFKSYQEDFLMFLSTPKVLTGNILENGRLYCALEKKTNIFSAGSLVRPISFTGKIDAYGNVWLNVSKYDYFERNAWVSKIYRGNIDCDGRISLRLDPSGASDFGAMVLKLFCNPFNGDTEKMEKFTQTRETLGEFVKQFRAELIA